MSDAVPHVLTFFLPDAGEGLTEAEIVRWRVAPGALVQVNDILVEVETAKSVVELPSPWTGRVVELGAAPGETLVVGSPLVRLEVPDAGSVGGELASPGAVAGLVPDAGSAGGETVPPGASRGLVPDAGPRPDDSAHPAVLVGYGLPLDSGTGETPPVRINRGDRTPRAGQGDMAGKAGRAASSMEAEPHSVSARPGPVLAKPPVRALAQQLGIDLATVRATGPGGIVTREDVVAARDEQSPGRLAAYPGQDTPWLTGGTVPRDGRATRVPVRSVRKRTAEAMVTSAFTAPHVTVFRTVDASATMQLVRRLREDSEFADTRITPLLIAAKALLLAVRRHPEINATWDDAAQEIVYKHYVNLGIAAQTPRGLIVPNIKDAHRLSLHDLALGLRDLTAAARAGTTTPSAMADGTITLTNIGVFGIDAGTPILSPGEAAILALGAIERRPWIHRGKVKARDVAELALSFDHRLVDGALGAVVLSDVARILADPSQGLVWS
ncbi:MAG: 2-oxo acid dehydrogenase subunit E2 [Bifidobacteriaceae bacterium]|jgi:pyruvate dehydrogenase E2 component (dihydrolipoamide acetyltransferase)|nr:2-oxo acid dehydrogenase subunit E2 [Bifidobacteriaceae bacterium]